MYVSMKCIEWEERVAEHTSFSAEVKKAWTCLPIPHTSHDLVLNYRK
jgi:hypothetical protein